MIDWLTLFNRLIKRLMCTRVIYNVDCGQTSFSRPDGGIMSPNFRHSSSHSAISCTYFINAGPRKVINLDFLFVKLEYDCRRDWLTVSFWICEIWLMVR